MVDLRLVILTPPSGGLPPMVSTNGTPGRRVVDLGLVILIPPSGGLPPKVSFTGASESLPRPSGSVSPLAVAVDTMNCHDGSQESAKCEQSHSESKPRDEFMN